MTTTPQDFRGRAAAATRNLTLRKALVRAAGHFREARERGLAALPDSAGHLARARQARLRTLENLPELLELLERNLTANGIQVHWAATAAEARDIACSLAKRYGAQKVVKGKSMISEEIALNPALEAMGLEVWETDLGEYIIQLAGEPPSHIIAPAVHKTRQEVAALFQETLGRTAEDSVALTAIARDALREHFIHADLGITGANMAVAEPGAVVLLENEGNIRLSTSCPRVHVAVMSLEKVVAGFAEATALLQTLPRSATGQKLSSYVSILSGPRRPGELDGPEAVHVIILDNGRSAVLADPLLREVLLCVRCGACLAACPVYCSVGGHCYGWSYSGPIGSLLAPVLLPRPEAKDFALACTQCGNCRRVCPVGIDHPAMLLGLRQRFAEDPAWGGGEAPLQRLALELHGSAAAHAPVWRAAATLVRRLDPEFRLLRRLPGAGSLARLARLRPLPGLARQPFHALWRGRKERKRG